MGEGKVSIPFKRETISKGDGDEIDSTYEHIKFQFPSNGKPYPKTLSYNGEGGIEDMEFQFPSNGKPYPKPEDERDSNSRQDVSIPFKRETISKARTLSLCRTEQQHCFNSLQTGNHIQREKAAKEKGTAAMMFQFPSNGKPYPKPNHKVIDRASKEKGFNSLQTGNHIQSTPIHGHRPIPHSIVSIPFKRETISKV